ncbi:UNVERIFIED_CONTAM: hypothetical protein RMT77_002969 [Armadillidium vulgare]
MDFPEEEPNYIPENSRVLLPPTAKNVVENCIVVDDQDQDFEGFTLSDEGQTKCLEILENIRSIYQEFMNLADPLRSISPIMGGESPSERNTIMSTTTTPKSTKMIEEPTNETNFSGFPSSDENDSEPEDIVTCDNNRPSTRSRGVVQELPYIQTYILERKRKCV